MDKIKRLKAKFDKLVVQREAARQRIDPDVEDSADEYHRLEQEVKEAYRALLDARYDAGQGVLD